MPIIFRNAAEKVRSGWNLQCVAALLALAGLGAAFALGLGIENVFLLAPPRPSLSKELIRVVVWLDIGLLCAPMVLGMPLIAARAAGSGDGGARRLLEVFPRFGPAVLVTAVIVIGGTIVALGPALVVGSCINTFPKLAALLGIPALFALLISGIAGLTAPLWLLVAQIVILDRERAIPVFFPILRISWMEMWCYRGTWLATGLISLIAILLSTLFLGIGLFLIGVPVAASLFAAAYDWVRAQKEIELTSARAR